MINKQMINHVINESVGIECSLKTIDGQMTFFSHLIQDVEQHRDGMAAMLKAGELEKQLDAIYTLLINELDNIHEANESIFNLEKENDRQGGNQDDQ